MFLKVLSQKCFAPISRLSYCMYLVHFLILLTTTARTRNSTYFSDYYIVRIIIIYLFEEQNSKMIKNIFKFQWINFLNSFILTVIAAFFFSILFESPIIILEKIFKNKNAQKSQVLEERNE